MHANSLLFVRPAGLLAGTLLLLASARAADTAKPESDAFPLFTDNYVKVSTAVPSITGDQSAFQNRTQMFRNAEGGIEDLRYSNDLSKDVNLLVDGHLLPGAEDYLAEFKVTKEEVGSVEAGYKRFRTFYDGVGGFFPLNNKWNVLSPESLWVDRGKFFVNATIALPSKPVFTFRYSNDTRNGRKDSTIWGDTDFTGVPIYSASALNPISSDRKIIPAILQLGERQETYEATMKHTIGATTVVLSLVDNRINNGDSRSVNRYPGELKPFPAIPSNPPTLVDPSLANNPNRGFDLQYFKEHATTMSGRVETVLSDKVTIYGAASYRYATEEIAASRLITADLKTGAGVVSAVGLFTSGGRPPYSYNSSGNLNNKLYSANAGLRLKPAKDLYIDAAVKIEDYKASGLNNATYVNTLVVQSTGVATQQLVTDPNTAKYKETPTTPSLDIRYTGIPGVSLYANFDYRRSPGTDYKNYENVTTSGSVILPTVALTYDNVTEKHSYYRAGANWTVSPAITLRTEVFKKDHENSFTGYAADAGTFFILDYDTYGARVTAAVKLTPTISNTSRYVYTEGKGKVAEDGFITGDSNNTKTHQLCETIDWAPNKECYFQANVNFVFSQMQTAYPKSSGAALDVLHNADNNYWNGSVVAGWVSGPRTEMQLVGTYYRADNYTPSLAAATTPYGMATREYSVTLGLKCKFSAHVVGEAKVGYFESNCDTTGGFTNFRGPVAYIALTHAL